MTEHRNEFIKDLFHVDMNVECRWVSDYWRNYIGFWSRDDLLAYVRFYLPIFNMLFNSEWQLIKDYRDLEIVRLDVEFRNFKPLTLVLEQISHLYFLKNRIPFLGMHYDDFYEIREWQREFVKIQNF